LALGLGFSPGASALAEGGASEPCKSRECQDSRRGDHQVRRKSLGTMGYGPLGLYPGFQGFGLGYHLRSGYGGDGLGVGSDGGYPFYGGPGYPHPGPCLRRIGGITPFPYFGGPGYPTSEHPHYFGDVGPLVVDQPVSSSGGDRNSSSMADYGAFSGALPYPESVFAPHVSVPDRSSLDPRPSKPSTIHADPTPAPQPRKCSSPASTDSKAIDGRVPSVRGHGFVRGPGLNTDNPHLMKVN
jgi:hypothetical protein